MDEYRLERIWKDTLEDLGGVLRLDAVIVGAMSRALFEKEQVLMKKFEQMQYEISLLEHSEEEMTGVTLRTEELKNIILNK